MGKDNSPKLLDWGDEKNGPVKINGKLLVNKDLLVGNVQQDTDSCVYIATLFMAHVCGDGTYDNVSKSILKNADRFGTVIETIKNTNFQGYDRMSKFQAKQYLLESLPKDNSPMSMSYMQEGNETVGETSKRILNDGYISMLEQNGHVFVGVGESESGKLIVWDTLLGEPEHGLREVDPNSKNLTMFLCAKVNDKFVAR